MSYVGKSSEIGWESYKKEHILIVEEFLGRKLDEKEVVHHLDGNKINNQIDNLWVTVNEKHMKAHSSLQMIGYNLYRMGFIGFDRDKGIYFLKDNYENFEKSEGLPARSSTDS